MPNECHDLGTSWCRCSRSCCRW